MNAHFTHPYLLNPPHKVTVNLVGAGGTGSQVLSGLARMHEALTGLGHPGLHVRCYDPDVVTAPNIGRQMFSPSDIGAYKSVILITRVNRFFGTEWEAHTSSYYGNIKANITVTCIDTAAGRLDINDGLTEKPKSKEPIRDALYWLDLGNLQKTGQCILGTLQSIPQPQKSAHKTFDQLKTVAQKFKQLRKLKEVDQGPSCSLAQAISRQDLFINSTIAQFGVNLLWKLFREGMITYHGCYVNLDSFIVNPIKI